MTDPAGEPAPGVARLVSQMLETVTMPGGTATRAAVDGIRVAGKTGTAQKAGVCGYQAGRHVPNFAGFAPADNPRCVAVVVI